MDEATEITSEKGLFYLVRLFFLYVPYLFVASFLGEISLTDQLKVQLMLLLGGALCLILDILLQTFLKQDFSGKVLYLFFIGGCIYLGYLIVSISYSLLISQRIEDVWAVSGGLQIFFLLYWVHLNIKKFSLEIWDLDLV